MKVWVQTGEEGHLGDGGTQYKSICVREVLPEGEGLNKQGGSVCIGRGGGFSTIATPLWDVPRGSETSEL